MTTSESILKSVKEAGFKFTGTRRMIVELFVENSDKYVTAKDLYDELHEKSPRVSFDTIYRTLSLLLQLKVVEKMEFNDEATRYRITCKQGHHHHVVCIRCGSILLIEDCPMEFIKNVSPNFTVVNHRFEIYGYCYACQP